MKFFIYLYDTEYYYEIYCNLNEGKKFLKMKYLKIMFYKLVNGGKKF